LILGDLAEPAAGPGNATSDAVARMIAKAYPNIDTGANEKMMPEKSRGEQ
jgi:hypothetical protein